MPPALWEGHADDGDRTATAPDGRTLEAWHSPTAVTLRVDGQPVDLEAVLDRRPEIRLAIPTVLGHLDPLARVFVPTRAHAKAIATLERHRFCVLTGPPEMGKTAIARMVALAKSAEGWDAVEANAPDDLLRALDPARPQVFVADDAFGSTEFRPAAAERWARELPAILRRLHEAADHWLIWTSRPAPLAAGLERVHREEGLERFPRPADVLVDAAALQVDEKALILLRHALEAGLPRRVRQAVREEGPAIVEHPHFTPERIRRLVAALPREAGGRASRKRRLAAVAARHLAEPTEAMAVSLDALEPSQRALLVAMLDQPPGPAAERDVIHAMREIFPGVHERAPADDLDRLTDHFLRRTGGRVDWVHPSWRDLVVGRVATDPELRRAFLRGCGAHGVALALSIAGGSEGKRALPLLVEDADWDAAGDRIARLVRDLAEDDLGELLRAIAAPITQTELEMRPNPTRDELVALAELALNGARRRDPLGERAMADWRYLAAVAGIQAEPPREAPVPAVPEAPREQWNPGLAPEEPVAPAWRPSFDVDRVLRDLT